MAPDIRLEDDDGDGTSRPQDFDTTAAQDRLAARLSRKRTKTGCLTCRRRRIKCGEERPICRNCVKSKRHCEGYAQRVVFKQPFYDFQQQPNGAAHIIFQAGPTAGPTTHYYADFPGAVPQYGVPQPIHPSGAEAFAPSPGQGLQLLGQPHPAQQRPLQPGLTPQHHQEGQQGQPGPNTTNPYAHTAPPFTPQQAQYRYVPTSGPGQPLIQRLGHAQVAPEHNGMTNGHLDTTSPSASVGSHTGLLTPASSNAQGPGLPAFWPGEIPARRLEHTDGASMVHFNGVHGVTRPQPDDAVQPPTPAGQAFPQPYQHHAHPINGEPNGHIRAAFEPSVPIPQYIASPGYEIEPMVPLSDSPNQFLQSAAVEVIDDDYYDLHSDEEMDVDTNAIASVEQDRQLSLSRIIHGNHISIRDAQSRRYDAFVQDRTLDHYRPEEHANPLKNPATARVFAHFISVTGPTISIFERHPRNTSVLFHPGQVPFSQQGLWTYTMPLAALRHQGLLHAMLALGSLHIARMTGADKTPSLQHYTWALRRVHECVAHPKKRLKATTIAASMLLGFYEVMAADHTKWNLHLAGSKQLFIETDFDGMMRQFKHKRMEAAAKWQVGQRKQSEAFNCFTPEDLLDQIPDIDESVVSDIVGRPVVYGEVGPVMTPRMTVELDLNRLEILKDLHWWYCKQDAFQSIISGNQLLMDYQRWAACPPRAPLGKLDAVYGSFDHVILLLGRIAHFASHDLPRKLKQIEANGGQWRPAPGMKMPKPPPPPTPSSATNDVPSKPPPPPAMPTFYGMAPPPNPNVHMPSAYQPANEMPTPTSAASPQFSNLDLALRAAREEHDRIMQALCNLAIRLGPAFQPLSPEHQQPQDTPFGPAIFYRSYDIGCLWAVYNMAMIVAIRSHPDMPPAAHMAVGIAGQQTMPYALEIGRIVAGIMPPDPAAPLNPSLGAALCESCLPSFFAAVQYMDPHQRYETVTRIREIARRTGWGTAEVIANGCETAWVRAGEAGRGPPYKRLAREMNADDPRLNGRFDKVDLSSTPNASDELDRRHARTNPTARLTWAIGIMGMEEDVGMKHA